MKNTFEVGEMVAVYGSVRDLHTDIHYLRGDKAKVLLIIGPNELIVKIDRDGWEYNVHPKQCRRLVKAERRRVWISERHILDLQKIEVIPTNINSTISSTKLLPDDIEFIEVRKPKGKS
jgi:hypothetical protein